MKRTGVFAFFLICFLRCSYAVSMDLQHAIDAASGFARRAGLECGGLVAAFLGDAQESEPTIYVIQYRNSTFEVEAKSYCVLLA